MKQSKSGKPSPGLLGPKPKPKPKPGYYTGNQEGTGYLGNHLHGNKPSAAVWSPSGLCLVLYTYGYSYSPLFLSVL